MMPNVDPLVQLLLRHEGMRRSPYRDPRGFLTVGVGHNLEANPLPDGTVYPLTVSQCMDLLKEDIAHAEDELTLNLTWFPELDVVRQAALTDLCFNIGINGLLEFHTFLGFMGIGAWDSASSDLLTTLYAHQLPQRAADLATMIRTGTWLA